jgi:hypothetical protein
MSTAACIEIARRFGELIAHEDYIAAHRLLTAAAQQAHSADDLRAAVTTMTSYSPGPIERVEIMDEFVLEEWPRQRDGEVASIYVALNGPGFCEAVTVIVAHDPAGLRISQMAWGKTVRALASA